MHPHKLAPNSTWQSYNQSSCMEARLGSWARSLWPGSRDSISVRHIGWQGSTYLVGSPIIGGYIHPQIRCWKSVGCTPSSTTSMCWGRQLRSMWDCSIFVECQGADQTCCLVPRCWWWEQKMWLNDVWCNWILLLSHSDSVPHLSRLNSIGGHHCWGMVETIRLSVMWYFVPVN